MPDLLDGGSGGSFFSLSFGSFLLAELLNMIITLANILFAIVSYIWNVLVLVANFLYSLIVYVGTFLVRIFKVYVLPAVKALAQDYLRLKAWLQHVFQPIINVVLRIRAWYFLHIFPIQKLIIEIIQRVRVALEILRLLHVKWAQKLDADLAKIQSVVTQSIQAILGTLNQIITTLGIVLDPSMILRRSFWLGTLWSHLGALKRAVAYGNNRPMTGAESDAEAADKRLLDPAHPIAKREADGTVSLDPTYAGMVDNMRAAAADYMPGAGLG